MSLSTAKHTKGAKRTMSAYTPCALRFYTSSTARGRYTHSRPWGDATLTRGRERRERSSASALQHPPTETRPPGEKSSPVADRSQEEHNEGAWGLGYGPVRLKELGLKEAAAAAGCLLRSHITCRTTPPDISKRIVIYLCYFISSDVSRARLRKSS